MDARIQIKDVSTGVTRKFVAIQVTPHLAVGHSDNKVDRETFKVYSIMGERPAIPNRIVSISDATKVAELLEETYNEFWDVHYHDEWKGSSIPLLAQWSVDEGTIVQESLKILQDVGEPISFDLLKNTIEEVKNRTLVVLK